MESSFYAGNRQALYGRLPENALIVVFAGTAIRKTADEFYPLYVNRNFVYLTGCGQSCAEGFVLLAEKRAGTVSETLFIQPPDAMAERWQGRRMKEDDVRAASGIEKIAFVGAFSSAFHAAMSRYDSIDLWLDCDRLRAEGPQTETVTFAGETLEKYPFARVCNLLPHLRALRTIKKPCEIDAMRKAMRITREGILDMMRASKPGMYEYEYKAVFDAALTRNGVLSPGFPSIISAGENNFCIHYYAYTGQAKDGDMILNDVAACWDYLGNDVSRCWPCNGKFSERQRLLYTCAYNTSEHMFSLIKPGMPMASIDQMIREYCFGQLKGIGLVDRLEDVGKYIWHGGAHHVGFDTHDVVEWNQPIAPGMVFCVDVGIYCEEWGIGFRLEDNCLVTETGCENLSADIPRSIEAIEEYMKK